MVWRFLSLLIVLTTLSACNKDKAQLEGTREVVLLNECALTPSTDVKDLKVQLPSAITNQDWAQAGGQADHSPPPSKVENKLKEIWSVSIGGGSHATGRLLAEPLVYNGRLYVLNTNAEVQAFDAETGEALWTMSIIPENASGSSLGGGIAADEHFIYVTSPYAEVLALDLKSGEIRWRTNVNSPIRTSPTIKDGRLFVVTINNELEVFDAQSGTLLWSHAGIMETAGLLGGASPAVSGEIVIVVYSSGEVYALRMENGHPLWSETLSSFGKVDSVSSLPHIRARPVIDHDLAFVVSHSGRMAAIDVRSGNTVWTREIGGIQNPRVAGNFIFLITSDQHIVCMTRDKGLIKWARKLDQFADSEQKNKISWTGPLIVNNNLIVANSQGKAVILQAENGQDMAHYTLPGSVILPPVIANKTIYFLTDDGVITAMR